MKPNSPAAGSVSLFLNIFGRCDFLFALLLGNAGQVLAVNDRAAALLGTEENCCPLPLAELLAEGQEDCLARIEEAASGVSLPLSLKTAAGSRIGIDCSVAALGEEMLVFGMYSDQENDRIITEMSVLNLEMANMTRELHKKNLQLAVSQQALAKADSMKKTFLAIIAHDLRGHVGGVSQLLSMLQQDYDDMDDAEKKECVTLASDEARRTFLLLEDLLSWSRSQLDQIEFTPVDCNLRALIEENIALLQSRAKEKGVALSHETPPSLSATLDRSMMGTVLRNLLNNALKFTAPGGRVLVSASQKGESVEIIVRDTGTGMSQEQLENLFRIDAKPVSTQGTSGEKGSGLGLILCKEFVEKNGGMIRAESVAGEGSSFFISLPFARGASDGA